MALSRHLVAAFPGSSTAARFPFVAGAARAGVAQVSVAKLSVPPTLCTSSIPISRSPTWPASLGSAERADATPIHPGLPDPCVQGNTYRDLIGRRGLAAMRTPAG